jgi:hypothetical protein
VLGRKGVPSTAEADTHKPISPSVNRNGDASLASPSGGWLASFNVFANTEMRKSEMRKSTTDRMNDDQSWMIGVLEPILLLLLIAVIAALLQLL